MYVCMAFEGRQRWNSVFAQARIVVFRGRTSLWEECLPTLQLDPVSLLKLNHRCMNRESTSRGNEVKLVLCHLSGPV
jgi:hypothetical protein